MKAKVGWVLLAATVACAPPVTVRKAVAVMPLQLKEARLPRPLQARLAAHVEALLEMPGKYLRVPQERLKQEWPRARRRRPQPCDDQACQLALGRRVVAGRVLELRVERNIMGQCEVLAVLLDVPHSGQLARARAPASCEEEPLLLALSKTVCHALVKDAAGVDQALTQEQCLIMSRLAAVDRLLDQFKARKRNVRDMAELERLLAEEVLQLKGAYQQVRGAGQGPWEISAICQLGTLYQAYAQVLTESYQQMPLPPAIRHQGAKATQAFRQQLAQMVEQKIAPMKKEAREYFARCLARAQAARVSTPVIERARSRRPD